MVIKRENHVMHKAVVHHLLNYIKCLPKEKKKVKSKTH